MTHFRPSSVPYLSAPAGFTLPFVIVILIGPIQYRQNVTRQESRRTLYGGTTVHITLPTLNKVK